MFLNIYHQQAAELGLTVRNNGSSISVYTTDDRYVGFATIAPRTQDIRHVLQQTIVKQNAELFNEQIKTARRMSFRNPTGRKPKSSPMLGALLVATALGGGLVRR